MGTVRAQGLYVLKVRGKSTSPRPDRGVVQFTHILYGLMFI